MDSWALWVTKKVAKRYEMGDGELKEALWDN